MIFVGLGWIAAPEQVLARRFALRKTIGTAEKSII